MFVRKPDDSVETRDGRVVLFSVDRFIAEIANGNACFICGASPAEKPFNHEHIIPDWVLKKYNLHSGHLKLPNGAELMCGRYVVPCCTDCNADLAERFEVPISEAFEGGYESVCDFVEKGGAPLLFTWLASLFLKTHLKHRDLRWHKDLRLGGPKIAEVYDWKELHHIHCIVRSFYTGADISPAIYGSLAVLPASLKEGPEYFDYGDLLPGKSVLIRLGDTAAVAVLNDSGAVQSAMKETFEALAGPLTRLQLRELMVRMGYCNILLEPRPRYWSKMDLAAEAYLIDAELPDEFSIGEEPEAGFFGRLFYFAVGSILERLPDKTDPQILKHVKDGHFTFLFDERRRFLFG